MVVSLSKAQTLFKYGIEVGYSVPKAPEYKHESYYQNEGSVKVTITRKNIASPLVGLAADLVIKKNLQLAFGVQYQKIGTSYHDAREGENRYMNFTYTSDLRIDQTFYKLCIPVSIGYRIKIWKFAPSFYVGVRPNYLLKGQYSSKGVYDYSIDSLDASYSYQFNPLDFTQTDAPARRLQLQTFYGFSTFIGQYIKLGFTANSGGSINYSTSRLSCFGYGCPNFDYVTSITFFIPPKKKKPVCTLKCIQESN